MAPLETSQWEAFEGAVLKGYQYIRGDGAAVADCPKVRWVKTIREVTP